MNGPQKEDSNLLPPIIFLAILLASFYLEFKIHALDGIPRWFLIVAFIISNFLDWRTTKTFIDTYGIEYEGNRVARAMFAVSPVFSNIFKLVLTPALLGLFALVWPKSITIAFTAVLLFAASHNHRQRYVLKKIDTKKKRE